MGFGYVRAFILAVWKTHNGFQIRDVGNHIILFVFDDETEADMVIALEPWSYDKHLVILTRYDGSCPIRSIKFHMVSFWVQVHGLPLNRLNESTAYEIGRSLGVVSRAEQKGDLIGGDDIPAKPDGGGGAETTAEEPPSQSGTTQTFSNLNVVSTEFVAPVTHNSHASITSTISEPFPCLESTDMPAGTDLFEVQIQTIDQELNKYDNHTHIPSDTRDTIFSSNINDTAQVHGQMSEVFTISPKSPIISQDQEQIYETRDMSMVQPNLRTWKRMVCQNCMAEQTMHAQATGKHSSGTDTELVAPSTEMRSAGLWGYNNGVHDQDCLVIVFQYV
nr:hypothetical protein CFP56_69830 [Quercus suber]